ncbi:ATP-binding cassette domain-containing protein [Kaarinaea lacus]
MLNFSHLSLRRGVKELLHDVSAIIYANQKVGITGANGVGKSSLFALILGELHADAGEFSMPPDTVIAHVAQETPALDKSAIEYVLDGDAELRRIEHAIHTAEQQHDDHALARWHMQLETIGGYSAKSRAAALMHGLGFSTAQEIRAVKEFSGGWRMRLNLAQALMCRSDLLLLDEPTNHLDLDAVMWLEDWLKQYPGTLLLISHDRDFLDNITTHVLHMHNQSLNLYTGNYTAFEGRRAEQLAVQQAAYEKQQKQIRHIQSFVDRFRAKATKAKQAQSRLKALQRMEQISQAHVDSPFTFEFFATQNLPNPLLSLREVAVGYGDKRILNEVTLSILPQDRIGLLGPNGAGKSTLIKLLAQQLNTMNGESVFSKGTAIGYFAQHQMEQLDGAASALLHLQRLNTKAAESELRSYLGGFAFHGDKALEPVSTFSGGEKARLALAILVYQKPNLLLLDEPTNHLDLDMRHALTLALQAFEGAVIVVSHDRHLLRTVCERFYLVYGGEVSPFDGDLADYQQWLKEQAKTDAVAGSVSAESSLLQSKKQARQASAEKRLQLQPLRNKVKQLEQTVAKLEQQKTDIDSRLAHPDMYNAENKAKLTDSLKEQSRIQKELTEAEEQWLAAMEALEQAEE